MPAGLRATVSSPPFPLAAKTISSALALVSLYASIDVSAKGKRSSALMISAPLKTTPQELVKTSFFTPVCIAAAITAFVPSTLTFQ